MKKPNCILWIACALLGAHIASAQVHVTCRPVFKKYLQFEPIHVRLVVENRLGEPIDLAPSETGRGLEFVLQESPGGALVHADQSAFEPPAVLESWGVEDTELAVPQWRSARRLGAYGLHARLDWRGMAYASAKTIIEIEPGLEIKRVRSGLPGASGETRTSILKTLLRGKGEHIFVRIEDEAREACLGVRDLGRVLKFFEPQLIMDAAGQIHVLHQSGPTQFAHTVLGSEGQLILREGYIAQQGGVQFAATSDGHVVVEGGRKMNEPTDDSWK